MTIRIATKMLLPACVLLPAMSCARVSVDPIEVKPIHITADINLNVKIDKDLDDFFAFQNKYQPPATQGATTQQAGELIPATE